MITQVKPNLNDLMLATSNLFYSENDLLTSTNGISVELYFLLIYLLL